MSEHRRTNTEGEFIYPSWLDRASLVGSGLDINYYRAKLDFIVNRLGEKHLSWWEHKGSNQCQICDLIVIAYEFDREITSLGSKSSLDSMTDKEYQDNVVLEQDPLWKDIPDLEDK